MGRRTAKWSADSLTKNVLWYLLCDRALACLLAATKFVRVQYQVLEVKKGFTIKQTPILFSSNGIY